MKSNSLFFIVVTLLIAGGAYWYFSTQTGNQPSLLTTGVSENRAQTQFATLVSELQPISFDTGIFSEASFMALVDLTTPITPETSGRPDPFAPIPGVTGK